MLKFITTFGADSFSVAGLSQTSHPVDNDLSRFAFIVYGISVKDFCDTIHKIYNNYQENLRYDDVTIKAANPVDTLRVTREGSDLYMTRGNLKVLYTGSVSVIYSLCKELRVSYDNHLQASHEMSK